MMRAQEKAVLTQPVRWQLFRGLAAVLLTAGCSTPNPTSEASPQSSGESSARPTITVYEDPAFTRVIGQVGHFAVECADYKDPSEQSLQPAFVEYYKVREDPAEHTPPLVGYVDPTRQRLIIGGTAPQCA